VKNDTGHVIQCQIEGEDNHENKIS